MFLDGMEILIGCYVIIMHYIVSLLQLFLNIRTEFLERCRW